MRKYDPGPFFMGYGFSINSRVQTETGPVMRRLIILIYAGFTAWLIFATELPSVYKRKFGVALFLRLAEDSPERGRVPASALDVLCNIRYGLLMSMFALW